MSVDKNDKNKSNIRLATHKQNILDELNKKFEMKKLIVLDENDPHHKEKKIQYKSAKKLLGNLARFYLWINKKFIN